MTMHDRLIRFDQNKIHPVIKDLDINGFGILVLKAV